MHRTISKPLQFSVSEVKSITILSSLDAHDARHCQSSQDWPEQPHKVYDMVQEKQENHRLKDCSQACGNPSTHLTLSMDLASSLRSMAVSSPA